MKAGFGDMEEKRVLVRKGEKYEREREKHGQWHRLEGGWIKPSSPRRRLV